MVRSSANRNRVSAISTHDPRLAFLPESMPAPWQGAAQLADIWRQLSAFAGVPFAPNETSDDGFGVWVVGGAVRDQLLRGSGEGITDIDVVIVPAPRSPAAKQPHHPPLGRRLSPRYFTWRVSAPPYTVDYTLSRCDTSPSGRHTEVRLNGDIQRDASRRDFTFNAIYSSLRGRIYDPYGGIADLRNRTVRFIGKPRQRMVEDYLRILRYVRMLALVGGEPDSHTIRQVQAQAAAGSALLAKERVRAELFKTFALPAAAAMLRRESIQRVLLPFVPPAIDWQRLADRLETCHATGSHSSAPAVQTDEIASAAAVTSGHNLRYGEVLAALACAYHAAAARCAAPDARPQQLSPQQIAEITTAREGHHGLRRNAGMAEQLKAWLRLTRAETRALHHYLDRLSAGLAA